MDSWSKEAPVLLYMMCTFYMIEIEVERCYRWGVGVAPFFSFGRGEDGRRLLLLKRARAKGSARANRMRYTGEPKGPARVETRDYISNSVLFIQAIVLFPISFFFLFISLLSLLHKYLKEKPGPSFG
ncbi:hypothetical protein OUZ56_004275 [Daphnia magna]|uniref:Uncharacterized protein n=1 Tax=Daphnia magna TaxID=35525 RepID=A0ABQ9YPA2_9CRUS|nr:hypothetical protein OUZ56_004275 [Daphnia magna]